MTMAKNGSTILMVLVPMTILILASLLAFKSTIFFNQFSYRALKSAQQELLVASMLDWAIKNTKKNYQTFSQKELSGQVQFSFFVGTDNACQGTIDFLCMKDHIRIHAQLLRDSKVLCQMSCTCSADGDKNIVVQGFQRNAFPVY